MRAPDCVAEYPDGIRVPLPLGEWIDGAHPDFFPQMVRDLADLFDGKGVSFVDPAHGPYTMRIGRP